LNPYQLFAANYDDLSDCIGERATSVRGCSMAAMCRNGIALEASGIGIASTGEGVGGLFPQGDAAPLPHLSSPADFFLVPEPLNYFPEFKYSNIDHAYLRRQTRLSRPPGRGFRAFIFSTQREPISGKLSRNSRGGGS
jgi:hypothetical protein